jgi:asparagine synthase (glutamine-hydrolysing)
MCGIVGTFGYTPTREAQVHAIGEMIHRGPDAQGSYADGQTWLGHCRLAILDPGPAGNQPMANAAGTHHLSFNGEIYNYLQLRNDLSGLGHRFQTGTDTEVLLAAYQQWGEGCLSRLRGMFALAIWDQPRQRLFLARDRTGKKPLFYRASEGRISFASEIRALLAVSEGGGEVDWEAIGQYLRYGYVPGAGTAIAGVRKLPPGHCLTIEVGGTPSVQRYWRLEYHPKVEGSREDWSRELREKLTEAVRLRMVSDVPLGAFLSGGIDSSLVVALMAQASARPVQTFSIGFREARFNELGYARLVAQQWKTEHHEFYVEPSGGEILPSLVAHLGEPLADASILPTWYLSRLARKHVTVALTGDGGDESFAGYERYRWIWGTEWLRRRPSLAQIVSRTGALIERSPFGSGKVQRIGQLLREVPQPLAARYPRWVTYFSEEERRDLYGERVTRRDERWLESLIEEQQNRLGEDEVETAMAVDIESYLPDDLLCKVDTATMAHSLEARSPFLDQEVMELAARLPVAWKFGWGGPKPFLTQSLGDLLPSEVRYRRKMGFGIPLAEWFRGAWREQLCDTLLGRRDSLLDRGVAERLIGEHLTRTADHSFRLWNLLVLEHWLDWIRKAPRQR